LIKRLIRSYGKNQQMVAHVTDGTDDYDNAQLPLDHSFFEVTEEEIAQLRADIQRHLHALDLPSWAGGDGPEALSKSRIRAMHADQRREVLERELAGLRPRLSGLLEHFANGHEVRPAAIDPELVPVQSGDVTGDLFRVATLLWSVPVSKGYGRRMRFLVRDRSNGKLIGVFGLTDPVFNLRARDEWIGWTVDQRRAGLVHVMDAYVVGAVPPYSFLLGGKLVAALIASAEVNEAFARRYSGTQGIISGQRKGARLVLVTVTSALGRSSLYNRLRLMSPPQWGGQPRMLAHLIKVGETQGYGHFHLSEELFRRLRQLLQARGHPYANGHQYGQGPNWRIRVSRAALSLLGLDPDLLQHGIKREIYVLPLAANCRTFLCGQADEPCIDRPSAREIAAAALERWVVPRGRWISYTAFKRDELRVTFGL
jgi:hypothetical protein